MLNHDHPDINPRVHPPVLLLIHIFLTYVLNWLIPLSFNFPDVLVWIGFALAAIGIGLAASAVSQFMRAHTTLDPHGSVAAVVKSGPYRFSRNPIYLGFVLLLIGFSFILRSYWGLLLAPVLMLSLYQLVIQHEEKYLEKKFGESYTSYRSRVRRWL